MGVLETAILYLLIGVAVAVALRARQPAMKAGQLAVWAALWPFFASELASPAAEAPPLHPCADPVSNARDRLHEALAALDATTGSVLEPQVERIEHTLASLADADRRVSDMDNWLGRPELDAGELNRQLEGLLAQGFAEEEPRVRSVRGRLDNARRLREMRDRTRDELERSLGRIDEIASRVVLLKFADHPERELGELLEDVALSVGRMAEAVEEARAL